MVRRKGGRQVEIHCSQAPEGDLYVVGIEGIGNPSFELTVWDFVEKHLAYRLDGTPTFWGSLRDLPSNALKASAIVKWVAWPLPA